MDSKGSKRNGVLQHEVNALLAHRLTKSGWKVRGKVVYTRIGTPELLEWLGIGVVNLDNGIQLNPTVGVRHQKVEEIVARFLGKAFHSYAPPTISLNLGYLMPEASFSGWPFLVGDDLPFIVTDLLAALQDFGYPFMKRHSDLSALVDAMRSDPSLGETYFRIPVGLLLLGETKSAQSYVQRTLADIENPNSAFAERFTVFAQNFERLTAHPGGLCGFADR